MINTKYKALVWQETEFVDDRPRDPGTEPEKTVTRSRECALLESPTRRGLLKLIEGAFASIVSNFPRRNS